MNEVTRTSEASEAAHHDAWAGEVDVTRVPVHAHFESDSCPENRDILRWMGPLKGKRVLEIGCGLGEASVYFALQGAEVTSVDISSGMLSLAQRLARHHGVRLRTVLASASNLSEIPDGGYDFVYAANLLHHVDIATFIGQVRSKLKPSGTAFFWDPVLYNPAIQVYRKLATGVRTPDEHPLRKQDLQLIRSGFGRVRFRFRWYLGLVFFLKYFLIDRIHPNQARYWKKIVDDSETVGPPLRVLHRLDSWLFGWIPGFRWLAWNIVIRADLPNTAHMKGPAR